MKQTDQQKIARFLYDMRVADEKPMNDPDDVTLTIQNILAEIRELGYDWHYQADIELHSIKDRRIMRILAKYYDQVDLYTKDSFLRKIDPKACPEIIDKAIAEYLTFSPGDRQTFLGFDKVMSMVKDSDTYYERLLTILEEGEHFSALFSVCKKLCRKRPLLMLPLIERYSKGVLLLRSIQYYPYLPYSHEITEKLNYYAGIGESDLNHIISAENYPLTVTTFEYYRRLCTVDRIRDEARIALRKIQKQQIPKSVKSQKEKRIHDTGIAPEDSSIKPAYEYPADGPLAALIDC